MLLFRGTAGTQISELKPMDILEVQYIDSTVVVAIHSC